MPGGRVSTLVLHFADVEQTLRAVAGALASAFTDHAVTVIDNNPADRADPALAAGLPPAVRLLSSGGNLGYAGGNNVGLRLALQDPAVEYAWILNPDAEPAPDALAELVRAADAHPDALMVGSRLTRGGPWRTGEETFAGGTLDPRTGDVVDLPASAHGDVVDSDVVMGSSLLLRTTVPPIIGLIPEEYFLYFEEFDHALRARLAGWRVLVARRSTVQHVGPWRRGLPTPAFVYYLTRNRILFRRRWGFPAHASHGGLQAERLRNKLTTMHPGYAPQVDELIGRAIDDALWQRWGRAEWIEGFAWQWRDPGAAVDPAKGGR